MIEKVLFHESFSYESYKGCALLLNYIIRSLYVIDNPTLEMGDLFLFKSVFHGLLKLLWVFVLHLLNKNNLLVFFSYLSMPILFFPKMSRSHCNSANTFSYCLLVQKMSAIVATEL